MTPIAQTAALKLRARDFGIKRLPKRLPTALLTRHMEETHSQQFHASALERDHIAICRAILEHRSNNIAARYKWMRRALTALPWLLLILALSYRAHAQQHEAYVYDAANKAFRVNLAASVTLHTICDSGCGSTTFADNSAFTFSTTNVTNVAFVVDDVGTNTVTENSSGAARMSGSRILYIDLSKSAANVAKFLVTADPVTFASPQHVIADASAAVIGHVIADTGSTTVVTGNVTVVQPTGTNLHAVLDSGTITTITNVVHVDDNAGSLTIDAPVGTPVFARLSDGAAALIGQKAMAASLPVVIASDQSKVTTALSQTTTDNDVDVVSEVPGTGATNLGKAEDAVAGNGDTGILPLLVRNDGSGTLQTSANGDYGAQSIDGYGATWMRAGHPNAISCNADNIAASLTQLTNCGVPGAGLSIYVTDITVVSTTTTAGQFQLRYGTGSNCGTGTTAFYPPVSASRLAITPASTATPLMMQWLTPLKIPANNALCVIGVATNTTNILVQGFIAP